MCYVVDKQSIDFQKFTAKLIEPGLVHNSCMYDGDSLFTLCRLTDACKLQAWTALDTSERNYTISISSIAWSMMNYHKTIDYVFTNCATLMDTIAFHSNRTSLLDQFSPQLIILLNTTDTLCDLVNATLEVIQDNDLYSFIGAERNDVELNFKFTTAYDITYRRNWFNDLSERLTLSMFEVMSTLSFIDQTLISDTVTCRANGTQDCIDYILLYQPQFDSLFQMFLDSEIHLNKTMDLHQSLSEAVHEDTRLSSVQCSTSQQEFFRFASPLIYMYM